MGMPDVLAFATAVRVGRKGHAPIALHKHELIGLSGFCEIRTDCITSGWARQDKLLWSWGCIDHSLRRNNGLRRVSPNVWAHNPCEGS